MKKKVFLEKTTDIVCDLYQQACTKCEEAYDRNEVDCRDCDVKALYRRFERLIRKVSNDDRTSD